MTPFSLPADYSRIQLVGSFEELLATPFKDGVNALCWKRDLRGDFGEVVRCLGVVEGIMPLDEDRLRTLALSAEGKRAVEVMLEDFRLLQAAGLSPTLDCIASYPRDEEPEVVPTDVYSFHADRAPVEADTYLCTYHGPSSEGLRQEQAKKRVDVPETRASLLELYGGQEDEGFQEFLMECCYDLHYEPASGAVPYSFGIGNLWRIALEWPGCPVPPCIHRAPETVPGQTPRLLLIS